MRYKNTPKTSLKGLNAELVKVEEAFLDVLDRQGDGANFMDTDLDMNSHRILNLPAPVHSQEPVRLGDVKPFIDSSQTVMEAVIEAAENAQASEEAAADSAVEAAESAAKAKEVPEITRALLIAQGLSGEYGFFEEGFTYNEAGDVGIDSDGDIWTYNGALPFEVDTGTVPSEVEYSNIEFNSASYIITSDSRTVQERLDDLPSEIDAAGTSQTLVNTHNLDPSAHPDLVSLVTQEADRAEAAADSIQLLSDNAPYDNVSDGIIGTVDGEYFSVIGEDGDKYLDLYKNVSGVADFKKSYPAYGIVKNIDLRTVGISAQTGNIVDPASNFITTGSLVSGDNGNLISNSNYNTTGYIEVQPSSDYFFYRKSYLAWYDANEVFISGSNADDTVNVQTSPSNAAYLRCSVNTGLGYSFNESFVIQSSKEPLGITSYGGAVNNDRVINLTSDNIAAKSIDEGAIAITSTGKNIFDKSKVIGGFFMSASGVLSSNSTYFVSDFIPVESGVKYHCEADTKGMRFITAFNSDKFPIKSQGNDSSSDKLFYTVTDPDVKYLKFSGYSAEIDSYQMEVGGYKTDYEAYKVTSVIKETLIKGDLLTVGKNKFDKNASKVGFFMGANGLEVSSATYALSDYIEVDEGETYFCTGSNNAMRFYAAFDANKLLVESAGSNNGGNTITVPTGVKYYRISVWADIIDTYQFELGSSATDFQKYSVFLNDSVSTDKDYDKLRWSEQNLISYGDSITFQESWQPAVANALGCTQTAYGVGGRRLSGTFGMCIQENIDELPDSLDTLLVLGGTNDWAQSVPLGDSDSVDINTFYGGLNVLIERLVTKYKLARIIMITTPYGELPQKVGTGAGGDGWLNPRQNNHSLYTRDYAEAVRVACKNWGLPYVDLDNLGWNTINIDDFTKDDGGMIHPDEVGGKIFSEVVIGKLRELTPL